MLQVEGGNYFFEAILLDGETVWFRLYLFYRLGATILPVSEADRPLILSAPPCPAVTTETTVFP
jgi:hypothetical protein